MPVAHAPRRARFDLLGVSPSPKRELVSRIVGKQLHCSVSIPQSLKPQRAGFLRGGKIIALGTTTNPTANHLNDAENKIFHIPRGQRLALSASGILRMPLPPFGASLSKLNHELLAWRVPEISARRTHERRLRPGGGDCQWHRAVQLVYAAFE